MGALPDLATRPRGGWPLPGVIVRIALGFLLGIVVLLVAAIAFLAGMAVAYDGRALPGVRVAGIEVAGLTHAQATALLEQRLPPLKDGTLRIRIGEVTDSVPLSAIGRGHDLPAMVDAALAIGHSGSPIERAADEVRALASGADISVAATFAPADLEALVTHVTAAVDRPATDASASNADKGFTVQPAVPGVQLDQGALLQSLDQALSRTTPGDFDVDVEPTSVAPRVTTAEVQAAVDAASAMLAQPLTLQAAGHTWPLTSESERGWIDFGATADGGYAVSLDPVRIQTSLKAYAKPLAVAAVNASWKISGDRAVAVIPAKQGRKLDLTTSTGRVVAALTGESPGSTPIFLATAPVSPAVTTALAQANLSKVRVLGQWTTHYTPYYENYNGKNIAIPTTQINGTVVAPGATFSFWANVDVSREAGYGLGGEIVNGHSDFTGALGGGICSCSTTLFNAALRAGLVMGARTNHYYYIDRYPVGLDATVYKDPWSFVDMTFRNDTANPIVIRGYNQLGRQDVYGSAAATFRIFGVPDGRHVSISKPTTKNFHKATSSTQQTSSLPAGQTKVVEFPADGFDSWVTVTVTRANGSRISQRTYYSHYARVNGLTLKGTA